MKIKYFLQLIILFLVVFLSPTVKSAELGVTEAQNWAHDKGEEILQILADKDLERKYAMLDKILYDDVDLDHAARFVVGRYWRKMSDEQKAIYVPLFKRYTAALYKSFPLDVKAGSIDFKIEKIVPNSGFYDVICSIRLNDNSQNQPNKVTSNNRINVVFSLVKPENKIMVRDLKIAESSLLVTYRERFYKMIHQDNDDEIDWFLEDLTALTEDKESENALKSETAD